MEALQKIDVNTLLWIQDHLRFEQITPAMKFITTLGNAGIVWIVITAILLLIPRYRRAGFASLIALALGFLITNVFLKNTIARVRPYDTINGLNLLVARATDWSFPSGHACSSFASASSIAMLEYKKEGTVALILATLIAFSRLYVGIHYPSDVLVGIVIGILCARISCFVVNRTIELHQRRKNR